MNVQAAPPPMVAGNTGQPPAGNPPVLGQQVPGRSGGLPAQSGLSVLANPMAQELQSYGRGNDTMLVHMTPEEVNSLQGLAMAHGGSLTINPHTGLPEAGWLGNLLPTILGAIATPLTGGLINPLVMSGLIGAGTGIITGDLKKGLLAGLQAYGGASLGSALGLKASSFGIGQAANVAKTALPGAATSGAATAAPVTTAAGNQAMAGVNKLVADAGIKQGLQQGVQQAAAANVPGAALTNQAMAGVNKLVADAGIQQAAQQGVQQAAAKTGLAGVAQRFGQAAKAALPAGTPGFIANQAPMIAGMGVMSGLSNAMAPTTGGTTDLASGAIDNRYQGSYHYAPQAITYPGQSPIISRDSSEHLYAADSQPALLNAMGQVVQPGSNTPAGTPIVRPVLNPKAKKGEPMYSFTTVPWLQDPNSMMTGYAHGGKVHMDDGAFVMPARETAEFGNGSTAAGQKVLAGLGGIPIQGRGDGVSDSIPASIGGNMEAKVADGEVLFQRPAVERLGRGSHKKGTKKLYDLMRKAEQSRKRTPRGGVNALKVVTV